MLWNCIIKPKRVQTVMSVLGIWRGNISNWVSIDDKVLSILASISFKIKIHNVWTILSYGKMRREWELMKMKKRNKHIEERPSNTIFNHKNLQIFYMDGSSALNGLFFVSFSVIVILFVRIFLFLFSFLILVFFAK